MSVPKSVIKFKKGNLVYISSVDRAQYTIQELTRAALRDVGKYICRMCNDAVMERFRAFRKYKAKRNLPPRLSNKNNNAPFSYWVRKREGELQVGIKHNAYYGVAQELGGFVSGGKGSGKTGEPGGKGAYGASRKIPKYGILRNAVYNNIPKIVEIESKYLSALESEAKALALIESEKDYQGGADGE